MVTSKYYIEYLQVCSYGIMKMFPFRTRTKIVVLCSENSKDFRREGDAVLHGVPQVPLQVLQNNIGQTSRCQQGHRPDGVDPFPRTFHQSKCLLHFESSSGHHRLTRSAWSQLLDGAVAQSNALVAQQCRLYGDDQAGRVPALFGP